LSANFSIVFYCIVFLMWFLRAKALLSARLSNRNSDCLFVRPSICPSHGWISQKRCKLGSSNLHSWLPGRVYF